MTEQKSPIERRATARADLPPIEKQIERAEERAAEAFGRIEKSARINQRKVIRAMQKARVSETHFAGSTGYGYGDAGRETLDAVFADVFGAEAALVRSQISTGTQAVGLCLYGCLRPGDALVSLTGKPYDSLEELIGIRAPLSGRADAGSLADFGVTYREVALTDDGKVDYDAARDVLRAKDVKVALIQRSRGYAWREALGVDEIADIVSFVRDVNPRVITVTDNCYGEFVDIVEPTAAGADLVAGSLIKNAGGGLAPTGGYVAGKAEYVEKAAFRLTAPGLGAGVGPTLGLSRLLFQGLYMAPHVVKESLKGAVFCAALMEAEGYGVSPSADARRSDIIQATLLGSEERLIAFCQGIQQGSAVDSFVKPEPWPMPGYDHPVIMAAGAFVQGASIELSADGPVVPPYIAYVQGGLVYESVKMGCEEAVRNLRRLT